MHKNTTLSLNVFKHAEWFDPGFWALSDPHSTVFNLECELLQPTDTLFEQRCVEEGAFAGINMNDGANLPRYQTL